MDHVSAVDFSIPLSAALRENSVVGGERLCVNENFSHSTLTPANRFPDPLPPRARK